MTSALKLRLLEPSDEAVFRDAQRVMAAEQFTFGFDYDEATTVWSEYLQDVEGKRLGTKVPDEWVPSTFLVADVDGEVVGRASIRHELNEWLAHEGGHIGYCVLPPYRGHGYAKVILAQSIELARQLGLTRVLLCCDDDNVASAKTIEHCGGVFDSKVNDEEGILIRRYWIAIE